MVPPSGPVSPSLFGIAFRTLRDVPLLIWRGDLVGAIGRSHEAATPRSAAWRWWWTVAGINALVAGIMGATVIAKSYSATIGGLVGVLNDFSGSSGGESLPFGMVLFLVLTGAAAVLGCLVLRVCTVIWTLAVRGIKLGFARTAAIVAVSQAVYTFPMAVMMLLGFLPAVLSVMVSPLTAMVFFGLVIVSEVSIYVGINKVAPLGKSPVIPHAGFTTLWVGMSVVAIFLVNTLSLLTFS